MNNISISLMQKSDIEAAAKTLSVAMLHNPLHVAVYRTADNRSRREIANGFVSLFRQLPGVVFLAKEQDEIVGVMRMISCSGKDEVKEPTESGVENDIDWRRTMWRNEWARHDPKFQHWHLGPIGVLSTHQSIGIGSLLMQRFCSEVDACMASAYLETDKDRNVEFYNKFGFRTVAESDIFGVNNRYMLRKAH